METESAPRITSTQNARVKNVIRLGKRRARDEQQQTVVEGIREVSRALSCGVVPTESFVCPELLPQTAMVEAMLAHLQRLADEERSRLHWVTEPVYDRMAYRNGSGGTLMLIPYQTRSITQLQEVEPRFLILLEGVEKPGNLGAILRTADAAGVDAVMVCNVADQPTVDTHNPNVIRASLGTLFKVPVVDTTSADAISWLHRHHIQLVAATPAAVQLYTAIDGSQAVAVALGGEAHGLSDLLLDAADMKVRIPMYGLADSLNLATSAALLLYEVVRQRAGDHEVRQRAGDHEVRQRAGDHEVRQHAGDHEVRQRAGDHEVRQHAGDREECA